jgi:hypothetical protein
LLKKILKTHDIKISDPSSQMPMAFVTQELEDDENIEENGKFFHLIAV